MTTTKTRRNYDALAAQLAGYTVAQGYVPETVLGELTGAPGDKIAEVRANAIKHAHAFNSPDAAQTIASDPSLAALIAASASSGSRVSGEAKVTLQPNGVRPQARLSVTDSQQDALVEAFNAQAEPGTLVTANSAADGPAYDAMRQWLRDGNAYVKAITFEDLQNMGQKERDSVSIQVLVIK